MGLHRKLKVSKWLDVSLEQSTDRICDCEGAIIQNFGYRGRGPPFLYFIIKDVNPVVELEINVIEEDAKYRLCGVIYYGSRHFTCHIVDKSRNVWYHDRFTQGARVKFVKNALNMSNAGWLKTSRYRANALVYTRLR